MMQKKTVKEGEDHAIRYLGVERGEKVDLGVPLEKVDEVLQAKRTLAPTKPRPISELGWDNEKDYEEILTHFKALLTEYDISFPRDRVVDGELIKSKPLNVPDIQKLAERLDCWTPEMYYNKLEITSDAPYLGGFTVVLHPLLEEFGIWRRGGELVQVSSAAGGRQGFCRRSVGTGS